MLQPNQSQIFSAKKSNLSALALVFWKQTFQFYLPQKKEKRKIPESQDFLTADSTAD